MSPYSAVLEIESRMAVRPALDHQINVSLTSCRHFEVGQLGA